MKKHSKTGVESRFQGTALGVPAESKPVKIEGGGPDSIDEWCRKTREHAISEAEKRALAAQDSPARDPASQEPPLRDSEPPRESEDVVMETE